ncbi:MAG: hypothetical protein V4712_15275 [Pseudomonadota bacterium]
MAIIVPEAQTPFSLVEQPRVNPNAPTGAEGIGALADVAINMQAKKVAAEQARMVREARLTAFEGLDELAFKYENDTNLDGLTGRWEADAGSLTGGIAKGLPAHLREEFQLSMRETVAPRTGAVRRREYALYQDREMASLNGDIRRYESSAAKAPDTEARDKILGEAAADIGRAVDLGLISAVEGDAMMADIPANVARVSAISALSDDPQGYLDRDEAGEFAALTPQEAEQNRVNARRLLTSQEATAAREAELAAKTADKALGDEADAAIKVLDGGLPFDDLPALLARTRGTPHYDRLQGALDGQATSGNFAVLPPADQKAEIERLRASATGDPADVGRLNRLKTIATNTEASLKADPLAHVRDRRIMPIEPVDIADPASVSRRIAEAETVFRDYTPTASEIRYFDAPEAERYGAILSGPDPDQALGVVASITATFGSRAPVALAQIGAKDKVAHLAGALVMETGDATAARTIFQGRALKAEGKGSTVAAELRRSVAAELAPAFSASNDPRLITLLDGADAHYAASGVAIADPKSDEARAAYRRSVQAAAAGTSRGDATYGGVQDVHGRGTLLPPGMTAGAVETAVSSFGESHWKRASATGHLPRGFANFSAEDRESWTVLSLPKGGYAIGVRTADGQLSYLQDDGQANGIYTFDLQSLVTGRSN